MQCCEATATIVPNLVEDASIFHWSFTTKAKSNEHNSYCLLLLVHSTTPAKTTLLFYPSLALDAFQENAIASGQSSSSSSSFFLLLLQQAAEAAAVMIEDRKKFVMVSDLIACDGKTFRRLRSKKKRSLRLIACFIFGFLACLAIFSSYEGIRHEDEYSRENRLSRGKSSTMVVSIMHVDYGMLATPPDSILLPSQVDESVVSLLRTCCGISQEEDDDVDDDAHVVGTSSNTTLLPVVDAPSSSTRIDAGGSNTDNNNNAKEDNLLKECEPTVQVRVIMSSPFWTVQTLDRHGKEKRNGGDELFVVFSSRKAGVAAGDDYYSLVAKVIDQDNGSYHLDFIEPPLSRGVPGEEDENSLTVYMLYTCGIGRFAPPLKDGWGTNGALLKEYAYNGSSVPKNNVPLLPPSLYRRPWSDGQVQTNAGYYDDDESEDNGHEGVMRSLKKHSNLRKIDDMDNQITLESDKVFFFGDDNMLAMGRVAVELVADRTSPEIFTGNHSIQLNFGNLPRIHYLLDEWFGKQLRFPGNKVLALVIGTSFFDIANDAKENGSGPLQEIGELDNFLPLGSDQVDHLMVCEAFIRLVREEYPEIDLYWRLPIPFPFHLMPPQCHTRNETYDGICQQSLHYLSYFRMQQMYQAQKQLMEELGVDVLDFFDAYYVSPGLYGIESGLFSTKLHKQLVRPLLM